jgi:hypothetical protein
MNNRITVFVTSLLVVNLTACSLLGDRVDCDEVPEMLRVTLPPSANEVAERCSKGINPTYRATFTMSPDDLESFRRSTPITDWKTDASDTVSFDDEAAKATSLLFGDFSDGAISMEVLVDTSNPDDHVVHYEAAFVD